MCAPDNKNFAPLCLSPMNAIVQPYASASGPPPDPSAPHIKPFSEAGPTEADLRATEELEQVK